MAEFRTYLADGTLQLSSEMMGYGLMFSYQTTVKGGFILGNLIYVGDEYTNFPILDSDIVAVQMEGNYYYSGANYEYSAGVYGNNTLLRCFTDAPVGSVATIYVFREAKYMGIFGTLNYGLKCHNAAGELTFAITAYALRTHNILTNGGSIGVGGGAVGVALGNLSFRREVVSGETGYFTDTYRVARRSGGTVYSDNLVLKNSVTGNRYPPQLFTDIPQQDIIVDLSNLDGAAIAGIPSPPPNASKAFTQAIQPNTTDTVQATFRIIAGTGNARLRNSIRYRAYFVNETSPSETVTVTTRWQVRNLSTGSGWSDVPGGSTSSQPSVSRNVNDAAEGVQYNDADSVMDFNYGVPQGHTLEFRLLTYTNRLAVYGYGLSLSVITNINDSNIVRGVSINPANSMTVGSANNNVVSLSAVATGIEKQGYSWQILTTSYGSWYLTETGSQTVGIVVSDANIGLNKALVRATALIDGANYVAETEVSYIYNALVVSQINGTATSAGATPNHSTGPFSVSVTSYETPVYQWSIQDTQGGNWSLQGDPNSSSVSASVSAVGAGATATATLVVQVRTARNPVITRYRGLSANNNTASSISVSQLSPGDQYTSSNTGVRNYTESLTVSGGSHTNTQWSFVEDNYVGTWQIMSQTLTQANVRVSSVPGRQTALVKLQAIVTVDGNTYTRTCYLSHQNTAGGANEN